jgi:hypothetical protein
MWHVAKHVINGPYDRPFGKWTRTINLYWLARNGFVGNPAKHGPTINW